VVVTQQALSVHAGLLLLLLLLVLLLLLLSASKRRLAAGAVTPGPAQTTTVWKPLSKHSLMLCKAHQRVQ
jgi:hypothetical protein